jgi:hypothetical protein
LVQSGSFSFQSMRAIASPMMRPASSAMLLRLRVSSFAAVVRSSVALLDQ